MRKLLTTTEFAEAIGASESSVRRWTNAGAIRTARTAGGHRRIPLAEAIRFARETGSAIVRPEVLGLPQVPASPGRALAAPALEAGVYPALCSGDAPAANGCIAGLFLSGMSVAGICDGAIESAMRRIGELWPDDPRAILVEHRATAICLHALAMLRQMLGEPQQAAPLAMGGAPDGDPYLLPSMMAGTVLAEAGYREMNFGADTPLELLAQAAREHGARIVWLSVKAAGDRAKLRRRITKLSHSLGALGAHLIVGGAGVAALGLGSSRSMQIMTTMAELATFARGPAGYLKQTT